MPVHLREVIGYLDTTLEIDRFRDYAPNGLQVEGAMEVGVTTGQGIGDDGALDLRLRDGQCTGAPADRVGTLGVRGGTP